MAESSNTPAELQPILIAGTKLVCELEHGDHWALTPDGEVLVVHPDKVPRLYRFNGQAFVEEEVPLS
jgi:hypothetical protein